MQSFKLTQQNNYIFERSSLNINKFDNLKALKKIVNHTNLQTETEIQLILNKGKTRDCIKTLPLI